MNDDLRVRIMSVTSRLLDFVCEFNFEDHTQQAIDAAKKNILNIFGISLAGSSAPAAKKVASLVMQWGGSEDSIIIAHSCKVPAHEAALANATMARALNLDEVHPPTGSHPFASIVPATLAVSEKKRYVSGKEFLNAIILGSEIVCRMRQVPDFCLAVSGWVSEIYTVFGVAIAAARIMKLSREEISNALGLAYSQASGNAQAVYDGAMAYQVQQGFAARSGIISAEMAAEGISGSRDFLEGKAGLYPVYYRCLDYDINRILEDIGKKYRIEEMFIRSYPVSGFLQAPAENLITIINENNLSADDIVEVLLRVNNRMYRHVCLPAENKYRPKTIIDAMFSLPFVIGNLILKGFLTTEDFSKESIFDETRLTAANKVKAVVDDDIERESIELGLSVSLHIAEVRTIDGKTITRKLKYAKGSPQRPMSLKDCGNKARNWINRCIKPFPEAQLDSLIAVISNLENEKNLVKIDEIIN